MGETLLDVDRATASQRYAARWLDLPVDELRLRTRWVTPFLAGPLGVVLTRRAERHQLVPGHAHDPSQPPELTSLPITDGEIPYWSEAIIGWPESALAESRLVTALTNHGETWCLRVYCRLKDVGLAHRAAEDLVAAARDAENPLRGSHLRATGVPRLSLDAIPRPQTTRDRLRLPHEIWDEIDVNVHRHLARAPTLLQLGLGARRGLLLHGPPGTGKTHLGRIIAHEVAEKATTIILDHTALTSRVADAYRYADNLAPTIIFIEDIDIVARDRGRSADATLQALLNAMDGPMTSDRCVITVATTNDVTALDEAAVRAARFDRVVEVPRPDLEGRRMILDRYVRGLPDGADIDEDRIARLTTGATGSDLREVLRHALLSTDGPISTATLVRSAAARGFGHQTSHGAYL